MTLSDTLQSGHGWSALFGDVAPTLDDIAPYVDDVINNAEFIVQRELYEKGGKFTGYVVQATYNGVYVRGKMDFAGKIIVNNAGVVP